jgi:hypothetical protein
MRVVDILLSVWCAVRLDSWIPGNLRRELAKSSSTTGRRREGKIYVFENNSLLLNIGPSELFASNRQPETATMTDADIVDHKYSKV